MKLRKRVFRWLTILLVLPLAALVGMSLWLQNTHWGFARDIADDEKALRLHVVQQAESWLGCSEEDGSHQQIIDLYNSHEPLAQGYEVTYTDNWCATFGSAVAIELDLTDIVPTECGCERQTELWKDAGRWEENDNYMPLPGDYIYYAWDEGFDFGDCTGWSDHVGIVVGTSGPFIKVIEGNKDDQVTYRIILRGDWQIRGFGLPDYASKA